MPSGRSKVSTCDRTFALAFGKIELTHGCRPCPKLLQWELTRTTFRSTLLPRLLSNLSCSCIISIILSSTRTPPRAPQALKSPLFLSPSPKRPIRKRRRSASLTARLQRKAARAARSASSRGFWPENTICPSTPPLPTLPGNGLAHRILPTEEPMSVL